MTNIQKPPVYKHATHSRNILPRVLETINNDYTFNNNKNNNDNINNKSNKIHAIKLPPETPVKQITNQLLCDMPNSKERQLRVDRILDKYRRPPSNPTSKQFSRSLSCNTESTSYEPPQVQLRTTRIQATSVDENSANVQNSGPRSVSPYALVDHSDRIGARQEKADMNNSLLSKSYSLKSLGEYRVSRSLSVGSSSVDHGSKPKSNITLSHVNNNDEDPPSSSSSSSSNSKSVTVKEENGNYCSPVQVDWTVGNSCEETVSDRIRRRSFYVKLK